MGGWVGAVCTFWYDSVSFGSFSLRELTCVCVSGAVNTQGFVWKFFYALYINFHSFIQRPVVSLRLETNDCHLQRPAEDKDSTGKDKFLLTISVLQIPG